MDRPIGVTLLASFFALQSLVNVIILYGYYVTGYPLDTTLYFMVISVAGFVAAYGLFSGRRWGRYGMMLLAGWEMLLGILGTFMAFDLEPTSPIQATTKLIVYAIVIYFLTRPEIADYFIK